MHLDQTTIDRSVKPGDDFYAYANGGWLKANEIPANEASWGNSSILQKQTQRQLQQLLQEVAAKHHQPGSNAHKLQALYNSGMDTAALDRLGVQPIQADLNRIDALSSKQAIAAEVTTQYAAGLTDAGPLFSLGHIADPIRNDVEIITLSQGGMGLPDKSYYFETSPKAEATRTQYAAFLQRLFELSGTPQPAAQAKAAAVLALETRLARGARTATENRNIRKLLNYYTLDKAQRKYPQLGLKSMFQQLRIPPAKLIVAQPEFFAGLHQELTATPLATWKDFLKARLLHSASGALSSAFGKAYFAFYVTALTGRTQMRTRPEQMARLADGVLGEALGKVYVEKYFPADAKKRMNELVQNVVTTFAERIQANSWMTAPTKEKALQKLSTLRRKIGYPDQWRDYSALQMGSDYFSNIKAARVFEFREGFGRVGKPVNRDLWTMTPPTLNAQYNPLNNEIVFPAGILQPPFFDYRADPGSNYGAIGFVIGHEITHGFDVQGSQFDAQGNLASWWTLEDSERFQALNDRVVAQFDAIEVLPGVFVDGQITVTENVADLGGVQVALDALRQHLAANGSPLPAPPYSAAAAGPRFSQEQRFFIAAATVWRQQTREEALLTQVKTDPHSPAKVRATQPLRNIDDFYAAFGIEPGDPMYLPPEERVVVW